jgi:crossover junction endodeoxyribonuclease RuvC
MNFLGIDPWTTTVWFAIISDSSWELEILNYGVIETTPKDELKNKLRDIWVDMKELISEYKPEIISIEKLFFQNNLKTGIDVAHARGVILYESIHSHAHILEYTPLEVKSAITGYGKADKKQLQKAIQMLFKLENPPKPDDAADAIWLAYMAYLNRKFIHL